MFENSLEVLCRLRKHQEAFSSTPPSVITFALGPLIAGSCPRGSGETHRCVHMHCPLTSPQ